MTNKRHTAQDHPCRTAARSHSYRGVFRFRGWGRTCFLPPVTGIGMQHHDRVRTCQCGRSRALGGNRPVCRCRASLWPAGRQACPGKDVTGICDSQARHVGNLDLGPWRSGAASRGHIPTIELPCPSAFVSRATPSAADLPNSARRGTGSVSGGLAPGRSHRRLWWRLRRCPSRHASELIGGVWRCRGPLRSPLSRGCRHRGVPG